MGHILGHACAKCWVISLKESLGLRYYAGSKGKGEEDRNPSSSGAGKILNCLEKESPTTEGKITSLKIEESVFAVGGGVAHEYFQHRKIKWKGLDEKVNGEL